MSGPVFPEGHPTFGCLPRKSRPGEFCQMAADRIKIIPEAYWDALAAQITLRPFVKTVLYQGRVGSCAAESSVQSLMIARAIAGLPHVVLNPYFVYHTTSRGRDGGSSIDDNLAFLMRYGCAPESVWPRSKGWQTEPSAEAVAAALEFRIDEFFDVASVPEMVSSNLDAFPVVFGAQGHAICAVAHKGSYPLIVNSYDVSWQDGGFGKWVNYSGINWSYGAFAVRVARET